jgi:sec-independent protein translocase protein TatA
MIGGLGFGELLLIFLVVVLLFGASRLASIGKGLGEGISNFRDALNKGKDEKPALEDKKNT